MPDMSRSSVDLPAPLWPTSATRPPRRSDTVMSRSASMMGPFDSVPTRPPARPSTAFFNERVLASKIGKSTAAPTMSMRGSGAAVVISHPVRHAGAGVAQAQQRHRATDHGDYPDDRPVPPHDRLAQQRLTHDLDEGHHGVQLDVGRERVRLEPLVGPDDRGHEEQQLREARDDRR